MIQPSPSASDLSWLMKELTGRVPHSRSALLLSADGLVTAAEGLETDAADHMAALASGLHSLARSAGQRFDHGGDVRQIVVELDGSMLFVSSATAGARLAVLTDRDSDPSVIGYEMAMLIKAVRPHLENPARQAVHTEADT